MATTLVHEDEETEKLTNPNLPTRPFQDKLTGRRKKIENAIFMDGSYPDVEQVMDYDRIVQILHEVWTICGWNSWIFPATQPVGLRRSPTLDNMKLLKERKYKISLKADGFRYLIYLNEDKVFAVDRNQNVFQLTNLHFVDINGDPMKTLLIDVECIRNEVSNDKHVFEMLIFDVINLNGEDVYKLPFTTRYKRIYSDIVQPRENTKLSTLIKEEKMTIVRKKFFELNEIGKLLDNRSMYNSSRKIDGIIFQPSDEPYYFGVAEDVLKWKPPRLNSVDFRLICKTVDKDGKRWSTGLLYVGNRKSDPEPMFQMSFFPKMHTYHNKIIECTYQVNTKKWSFLRERTDRKYPNSMKTASTTYDSICHPIHKSDLLTFVSSTRRSRDLPSLMDNLSLNVHTRRSNRNPRK